MKLTKQNTIEDNVLQLQKTCCMMTFLSSNPLVYQNFQVLKNEQINSDNFTKLMLGKQSKFAPTVQSLYADQYFRMLSNHDEQQQQTNILRCSMVQQLFVGAVYRLAMNYRSNQPIKDNKALCSFVGHLQDIYKPIIQDSIATHFDNIDKLENAFRLLNQMKVFVSNGTNQAAFHSLEQTGQRLAQIDSSIFSSMFRNANECELLPEMFKMTNLDSKGMDTLFYPNIDLSAAKTAPEAHAFHKVLFDNAVDQAVLFQLGCVNDFAPLFASIHSKYLQEIALPDLVLRNSIKMCCDSVCQLYDAYMLLALRGACEQFNSRQISFQEPGILYFDLYEQQISAISGSSNCEVLGQLAYSF